MAEDVACEILDVFRIDFRAAADEQCPHLRQASPADDRARRGAEIDAVLDELGRRMGVPVGVGVVGARRRHEPLNVRAEARMQEDFLVDGAAQLDDAFLRGQRVEPHALEIEVHQLLLFLGRQVADVHHDGEAIGRRFRERERALSELHRVHRRDREAEGRQLVGRVADRHRAVLQPLEKRALRFERDAIDLVEQDHFGRGERAELGHQLAGRRVDHLEADDFGRLHVGASLQADELRVADRREDDAEERLADAGHAAQQQVAGVDLPVLLLVVRRGNLRQQHDVGERLGGVVADQRLAAFGDDRVVEADRLLEVWMHGECHLIRM